MSTVTSAPGSTSGGRKAKAMPWPSTGEKLPLVTAPAGFPSTDTAYPSRGGWRPSTARPRSRRDTPRARSASSAAFPAKRGFSAAAEPGPRAGRAPVVTFVHGGPDPYLDRQFDAWLEGSPTFVPLYQVLNCLCRAGTLPPGDYAVTH